MVKILNGVAFHQGLLESSKLIGGTDVMGCMLAYHAVSLRGVKVALPNFRQKLKGKMIRAFTQADELKEDDNFAAGRVENIPSSSSSGDSECEGGSEGNPKIISKLGVVGGSKVVGGPNIDDGYHSNLHWENMPKQKKDKKLRAQFQQQRQKHNKFAFTGDSLVVRADL